ncbi:MAG: hypothetical protein N2050_07690 [Flavobacteriales bacterium]|nr:hypothetical protein [Flavobacteriales bacterium]
MNPGDAEQLAAHLCRHLNRQGSILIFGDSALDVALVLEESGFRALYLSAQKSEAQMKNIGASRVRWVKAALLNIPFHHFLQAIVLLNPLALIDPLHWHALPEIFGRALMEGGTVFIAEKKKPAIHGEFRHVDRLMREAGFVRLYSDHPGFFYSDLENYAAAWWGWALPTSFEEKGQTESLPLDLE